jgi:hypothetical protein
MEQTGNHRNAQKTVNKEKNLGLLILERQLNSLAL